MAPKKPTVTSSSTRSARVKGGSNPVVTQGAARNRAVRTTLGPAPKQRPLATGGTKGPLQGGTRTSGRGQNPPSNRTATAKPVTGMASYAMRSDAIRKMEAGPARVGPNMGQQSTSSSAGPRSVRPANKPAAKPAAKPTAPATTTPRVRTTTSYGPPASQIKPKGAGQGSPLSNIQAAATKVTNTVKNAASQVSKGGVGTKLANLAKSPIAKNLGRAAVPIGIVAGLNEQLNPNSARNQLDAKLLRRIGAKFQGKPAKPAPYKPKFSANRTIARVKASFIKGSPVLGPKIVGPKKVGSGSKLGTIAQAFDKSFAAARKAGKSAFTFQGKRYNTKMK